MERAFRNGPADWVVRVGGGRLVALPGIDPQPRATLRMGAATFARVAAGQQIAGSAAMSGQLQIEGDLRLVARLSAVLGQPPI